MISILFKGIEHFFKTILIYIFSLCFKLSKVNTLERNWVLARN